jgi:hypothetical protein
MNVAGIAIAVFVAVLGIVVTVVRKLGDDLAKAKSSVTTEFLNAYQEFGHVIMAVMAGTADFEKLQTCIARLKNLHCASALDLPRLVKIRRFLSCAIYLAVVDIVVAVTSLVIGLYLSDKLHATWRFFLVVGFPVLLLILQAALLCATLGYEKYLKETAQRYGNLEYQA